MMIHMIPLTIAIMDDRRKNLSDQTVAFAVWMKIQVDVWQERCITERDIGSIVALKRGVDISYPYASLFCYTFNLRIERCYARLTGVQ